MKTLLSLVLVVSLSFISSCGLLDDLDEISFDTEVTLDFFVNETESFPEGATYVDQALLDITSDPDVAEYADKIKDVKVNKITYVVTDLTHSGITFSNGKLTTVSNNKVIATLVNLPLTEFATGDFTIDAEGFSLLSARLKNLETETILLQGTISETPIAFKVECIFDITITAEVLK